MTKYIDVRVLELAGIAAVLEALHLPFGMECKSEIKENEHWCSGMGVEVWRQWHSQCHVNIAPKDLQLMQRLVKAGDQHAKALRGIMVWLEIDAPRYWWQEMDTYRIGTDRIASESTMHMQCKGMSTEQLLKVKAELPEGTHQKRVQVFSYQTLRRIYHQRHNHRLPHWQEFCNCIKELPFAEELILAGLEGKLNGDEHHSSQQQEKGGSNG